MNNIKSNTMPPQNMQQEMTPDEAAASMGFSNTLMEQLLAQQNPPVETEAPVEPQEAPQQEETPEPKEGTIKEIEGLKTEFSAFKEEVSGMIKKEIDGLRDDIKSALSNEQD